MPARIVMATLMCLLASTVHAQYQKYSPAQKYETPAQSPAQNPAESAPGYYAAPPSNGTFAGPSRSIGINGFALHLPAMSLRLPTLQLPSITNMRSQPKMLQDAAQAPFVQQHQPVAVGAPVVVQAVAPAETPNEAPLDRPSAPTQKDRTYQKDVSIERHQADEVAELRRQVALLAQSLERMTQLAEVAARPQVTVDRMSHTQPLEPASLETPTRLYRLPRPAIYQEIVPAQLPRTNAHWMAGKTIRALPPVMPRR